MFVIGATLVIAIACLVALPLFNLITYRPARLAAWVVLWAVLTWPVLLGPAVFKLECTALAEMNFGSGVDARHTGYLDRRPTDKTRIETHMDQFILDRNVDDLVAGRVAFFEQLVPESKPNLYARYFLAPSNSTTCTLPVVGGQNGRSALGRTAPGKCLAVERVAVPSSLYEVSMDGDFNLGVGVSKLQERASHNVLATLRTFGFAFLYQGTSVCPALRVVGDDESAHTAFTTLVLKDSSGKVRTVEERK